MLLTVTAWLKPMVLTKALPMFAFEYTPSP